ncbi:MAG TPA: hypothetical protein VK094_00320 [Pseudogracilibacillus sp.]|nr:hypothetical protein [Pseudogracilibacillus sp.]
MVPLKKIESLRNKVVKNISVDESFDQDGEINLNIYVDFYEEPKRSAKNKEKDRVTHEYL